jgi:putative toxin-antitoxin system antitoxin component (TIGR02293 family)
LIVRDYLLSLWSGAFMPIAFPELGMLLGANGRQDRPASPLELIDRIQSGLPVTVLERVCRFVAPSDASFKYRIVSRATLNRRRKARGARLSSAESERLARIARVWVFAREVWGSDAEARAFLFRPHMMLEGRTPIEVAVGTNMGAELVEDILGRLRYGSAG